MIIKSIAIKGIRGGLISKLHDDFLQNCMMILFKIKEANANSNQQKLRLPDLLIVITGGEIAYTRNDGVKVIPIGCLKD